jgi:hypothetical protein
MALAEIKFARVGTVRYERLTLLTTRVTILK